MPEDGTMMIEERMSMQVIAELVRASGVPALVEYASGGVATIIAGEGPHGAPKCIASTGWKDIVEPGELFWIGVDNGETIDTPGGLDAEGCGATTEAKCAALIVAQCRMPFGEVLSWAAAVAATEAA